MINDVTSYDMFFFFLNMKKNPLVKISNNIRKNILVKGYSKI